MMEASSTAPITKEMLWVPVLDDRGKTIAIVQALNKRRSQTGACEESGTAKIMDDSIDYKPGDEGGFTPLDEWKSRAMAMYLSVTIMQHSISLKNDFLKHVSGDGGENSNGYCDSASAVVGDDGLV